MASGTCIIHEPVIVLSLSKEEAQYLESTIKNAIYGDETESDTKLRKEIHLAITAGLIGAR